MAILTALVADRYAVRGMTMIILGTMATIGFALFLGKSAFCRLLNSSQLTRFVQYHTTMVFVTDRSSS